MNQELKRGSVIHSRHSQIHGEHIRTKKKEKSLEQSLCKALIPVLFSPCDFRQAVCYITWFSHQRNPQLHGTCAMYPWKSGSITISSLVCLQVVFCLMSRQENPRVPHWCLMVTPPTDGLCLHLASTGELNSLKAERMRAEGGVFLPVCCNTFHLSDCCFISGMYLFDLTYVDSAYPSTGSILENEQRSNLMNNILRIISDLQRSCTYGEHAQPHVHGVAVFQRSWKHSPS